ncbi:hypothetical protein ACS0TY_006641 [Phlomoides rotata]
MVIQRRPPYGAILGHLKDRHDLLEKIKGCIVNSRGDPIIDTKGGLFVVRFCGFQLLVAIVCGRFGPVWCSLVAVWCCFQLLFVYMDIDNEEEGKPVADYFGLTKDTPKVLGYTGEDTKKYILDKAVTLENIKEFGEAFLEDKLKAFYKSDPIPETNDGDVKIVVGNNFDDIVLDESKDVLLEIYAPWCGHCQSLEPTYNKLAKHLRSIESLIVAKMDGTTNEHPRAKADGYPTILFFPTGKKSADPVSMFGYSSFDNHKANFHVSNNLVCCGRFLLMLIVQWWHFTSSSRNMLLSLSSSRNQLRLPPPLRIL